MPQDPRTMEQNKYSVMLSKMLHFYKISLGLFLCSQILCNFALYLFNNVYI